MPSLQGIHHVTAICGDPQLNVDFYAGLLGLRLVKKTVNFDDPGSYHLYYGDRIGTPGTLLTFFAWPSAPRGKAGAGDPVALTFAVPAGSLAWWTARLAAADVPAKPQRIRESDVLAFQDPDGMQVQLVESARPNQLAAWTAPGIPESHAIHGIYSVTLGLRETGPSATLYTAELGFEDQGFEDGLHRFGSGNSVLDVRSSPANHGRMGAGSIHHLAFRTADDTSQQVWSKKLIQLGLHVSPVMDRKYFHSIYFREPGGVLFEIATDGPGMTVDETEQQLGTNLALPSEYEPLRRQLESSLPPVHAPHLLAAL